MTAPISNEPTTTRLHHYAGHYFFAHKAQQRGDVETNNTTARPQQGSLETGITSAPEKCTKNTHFSPAKAMAVSTPHRHTRAKATGVSDNRDASLTGTGSATHSH